MATTHDERINTAVDEAQRKHGLSFSACAALKGKLQVMHDGKLGEGEKGYVVRSTTRGGTGTLTVDEEVQAMRADAATSRLFGGSGRAVAGHEDDADLDAKSAALSPGNTVAKMSIGRERQRREQARAAQKGGPAPLPAVGDTSGTGLGRLQSLRRAQTQQQQK